MHLPLALRVVDLPQSVREELHGGVEESTPPSRQFVEAAGGALFKEKSPRLASRSPRRNRRGRVRCRWRESGSESCWGTL